MSAKTIEEIILEELERGPATVKGIAVRLQDRVRIQLERMRVHGSVLRDGRGGPHHEFIYKLLRSKPNDLA
jgi:hypothetical protein